MPGLLADANLDGHMLALVSICTSQAWIEVWTELRVPVRTFAEVGLAANASDTLIWQTCQQHDLILVTGNRNQDGPDSLEAAIRTLTTAATLPVMTVGDPNRLLRDREYAGEVAARLMEYLIEIEDLRGTGRLYLP